MQDKIRGEQLIQACAWNRFYRLIGKKYTLALLNLLREGDMGYNEIHSLTNRMINPTLLSRRLHELLRLEILAKNSRTGQYSLTRFGKDVHRQIEVLKRMIAPRETGLSHLCFHYKDSCLCDIRNRK